MVVIRLGGEATTRANRFPCSSTAHDTPLRSESGRALPTSGRRLRVISDFRRSRTASRFEDATFAPVIHPCYLHRLAESLFVRLAGTNVPCAAFTSQM